jgi:tetratricopeptide (TPR) repeat protein
MPKTSKRTAQQLRAHLDSLRKEELVELLLDQTQYDDDLRDRLLIDAVKRGDTPVDLKWFERSIDAAVFDLSEHRYGGEHTSHDWSHGVHKVIERLIELYKARQAPAVITLTEHALDALTEVMDRADDSDGYISVLVDDLKGLHHDACVAGRPDQVDLATRLFYWEVDGHWDIFVDSLTRYADVLGPGGITRFRELAQERWATVRTVGPGDKDEERYGSRYRITRIMESLAKQAGDVDELVAVKSRDLSIPYDWLRVAEVLRDAGRHAEALEWAERGNAAFPDEHDSRLDEFLCEEYHRAGRHADALALASDRFASRPELSTYQPLVLNAAKAGAWPERRAKAIAVLRRDIKARASSSRARGGSRWLALEPPGARNLVEILLWEDDPEAAWQEAVAAGVPHRTWMLLAEAREDAHPRDAIPIYQREVEHLIGTKNNRGYADAVKLMAHIKKLFSSAGAPEDFLRYAKSVRATHKPKRNLMKLFDTRRW